MRRADGRWACVAVAASVALAGCGGKTAANEENFSAVIERHLDEEGHLCLGTDRWPVDLHKSEVAASVRGDSLSRAARMQALQNAGLVSASDIEIDEGAAIGKVTGRMKSMVRYTLTDAARRYTREADRVRASWEVDQPLELLDLCWGRKVLDKVLKWEGPMEFGAFKTARVIYRYEIVDVADWAKGSEVREAFKSIDSALNQAVREDAKGVQLTSEGWEPQRSPFR